MAAQQLNVLEEKRRQRLATWKWLLPFLLVLLFGAWLLYQVAVRHGSNTALLHQLVNPVTGLVYSIYSGRRLFYLVRNRVGK